MFKVPKMKEKVVDRFNQLFEYKVTNGKSILKEYEILTPTSYSDEDDMYSDKSLERYSTDELFEEDEPEVKKKIDNAQVAKPDTDVKPAVTAPPKQEVEKPQQPQPQIVQRPPVTMPPKADNTGELKDILMGMVSKVEDILSKTQDFDDKLNIFNNKVGKIDMAVNAMREPTEEEKFDRIKDVSGAYNTRVSDYFNTSKFNKSNMEDSMAEVPFRRSAIDVKSSFSNINESKKKRKK